MHNAGGAVFDCSPGCSPYEWELWVPSRLLNIDSAMNSESDVDSLTNANIKTLQMESPLKYQYTYLPVNCAYLT